MSEAPSRVLRFEAEDGTPLAARLDGPAIPTESAVLVLPGFWRRAESPRIRALAQDQARRFTTLTLDFRGHGLSGGRFTFGRLEHLDVEAACRALAQRGARRVAVVGLSMGGAAAVTTLASGRPLALEPAGLLTIAAPCAFGRIRPRPWRGRRDIAWEDSVRVPRIEWTFPFTSKLAPETVASRLPEIPLRFLHGRHDWLVDHALGEGLHDAAGARGDLVILEAPGRHADELLGAHAEVVSRLVRPFVAGCLAPVASARGEGDELDAGPWREGLVEALRDTSRHAREMGRIAGEPAWVRAFAARDGAHLVARVGETLAWARGLRDGTAHGLNALATAWLLDGPTWPEPLRRAAESVLAQERGGVATRRHHVRPLASGVIDVAPWPGAA